MPPAAIAVRFAVPENCAGMRLDQVLAQLLPQHSRSRLQAWLGDGRIRLDGAAAPSRRKVWGGERIEIDAPPESAHGDDLAEDIALTVVHEDADLLVIDKPAGLVVHPGNGNRTGTLLNALLARHPAQAQLPRAGIVHRLDKDTSGLMVVARTAEAQTALVRQLQAHSVSRTYLAVAAGELKQDCRIEAPVGRHPTLRTRMAVVGSGKPAVTHVHVRQRGGGWTLIECSLETGRTHQIRVHLDSIGHPLLGDPVYGAGRRARLAGGAGATFSRQALHAWRLALDHPASHDRCSWQAEPPTDFIALLAELRAGNTGPSPPASAAPR